MNFRDNIFPIGKIVNTFGKLGAIKLLLNDEVVFNQDELIDSKNKILFYKDAQNIYQTLEINKVIENTGNLVVLVFNNYKDINEAEKLKNITVYSAVDNQTFTKAKNYFEYEFIYDNNSTPVIDVMNNGQYILFKVKVNNKDIWVPNVDEYISNIDDQQKRIEAINIERLI